LDESAGSSEDARGRVRGDSGRDEITRQREGVVNLKGQVDRIASHQTSPDPLVTPAFLTPIPTPRWEARESRDGDTAEVEMHFLGKHEGIGYEMLKLVSDAGGPDRRHHRGVTRA